MPKHPVDLTSFKKKKNQYVCVLFGAQTYTDPPDKVKIARRYGGGKNCISESLFVNLNR